MCAALGWGRHKGSAPGVIRQWARRESSWYITVRLATVWDWVAERPSSFMGITDSAQVIPTWVMLSQRERERREEKEWDCFCHKKRDAEGIYCIRMDIRIVYKVRNSNKNMKRKKFFLVFRKGFNGVSFFKCQCCLRLSKSYCGQIKTDANETVVDTVNTKW